MVGYLLGPGRAKTSRCWGGWSREALSEWPAFLRLALPATAMLCIEWWLFEIVSVARGCRSRPPRW